MAYYATNFIYDGIPSEKLGLFLCNTDKTGMQTDDGGGSVKIHTDKTPLMDHSYLLGVEYEDSFEFELTFGSYQQKDRHDISVINNHLIGKHDFCKLQILQPDMTNAYYNCIMNDFEIISFGNLPFAFKCKVICDRGWALGKKSIFNYKITNNKLDFIHKNISHATTLTFPTIEFKVNKANGAVSIVNKSNNNYETKLTELSSGEIVTMNQLEIITSSLGLRRIGNFNKHWFELVPGVNSISVVGDIDYLKISYEGIRKFG